MAKNNCCDSPMKDVPKISRNPAGNFDSGTSKALGSHPPSKVPGVPFVQYTDVISGNRASHADSPMDNVPTVGRKR